MEWERLKVAVEKLYTRPSRLSDPYEDFSKDELNELISTPDNTCSHDGPIQDSGPKHVASSLTMPRCPSWRDVLGTHSSKIGTF